MSQNHKTAVPKGENTAESHADRSPVGLVKRLSYIAQGVTGGLIGNLCCLLPAVAIATGVTGGLAATLVSLGRFRLYALIVGLAFIALASWLSLRRSRSCCSEEEYERRRIAIPLTMLASFGVSYGLVMYLIVPILYKLG